MTKWVSVSVVLALIACQQRYERSAPFKCGSLQVHLAQETPAEGYRPMFVRDTGETVYMEPQPALTEAHLRKIAVWRGQHDDSTLALMFTEDGTAQLARVTAANVGKRLAFVIDGRVVTAPVLRTQITEGEAVIESGFTEEEATQLAKVLSGE